jgi:predicted adenylyl cyclase CyaB
MEIEARVKIKDVEKLKQQLIKLGATFAGQTTQEDRYFYTKEQMEKKAQGPGSFVLRTRKSDKCFLTYKAFTTQLGAWDEHEVQINDAEKMNDILLKSGFVQILHLVKSRIKGELDEFELCVDDVKELGTYLEVALEGKDKKTARKKLLELLGNLGFNEKDIEHRGYPEIMLAGKFTYEGMK